MLRTLVALCVSTLCCALASAQPAGYTYQGLLRSGGAPANGPHDFFVAVYDAEAGGTTVGEVQFKDIPVEDGVFTIQIPASRVPIDFQQAWVQIRVRPGASSATPSLLTPRQRMTTAYEALRAYSLVTPIDQDVDHAAPALRFERSGGLRESVVEISADGGPLLAESSSNVEPFNDPMAVPAITATRTEDPDEPTDTPAILALAKSVPGYGIGLRAEGNYRGVYGIATGVTSGFAQGVRGDAGGVSELLITGVTGSVIGGGPGGMVAALYGSAIGSTDQAVAMGVYGTASNGSENYAGFFGSGDVYVENDILKDYSGTAANAVPIAYGTVESNGTISGGSGNFSVSRVSAGLYDITIDGVDYSATLNTTTVTPYVGGSTAAFYRSATASETGVRLRIRVWDSTFALSDNRFYFISYGPATPTGLRSLRGAPDPAIEGPEPVIHRTRQSPPSPEDRYGPLLDHEQN